MEYFSRKLAVLPENEAAQRLSLADHSNKTGLGNLKSLIATLRNQSDELSSTEANLLEVFNQVKEERNNLERRREELEKKQRAFLNRGTLLENQEKWLEGKLEDLLAQREKISSLEIKYDKKILLLQDLKKELGEKRSLVGLKKKQLHERQMEVKNLKTLLEDAKAEKYESAINHIVVHSKELEDIKDLCMKLPKDNLRLSVVCKDQLDQISQMKYRQAGIYAVDLAPTNVNLVNLNRLKKEINQQKRKNLLLFNKIKNLHQQANFKPE